ncbi:MAG TPA: diacylglycerol kinase family protein [Anaeromyxobacteraceae bacterium]
MAPHPGAPRATRSAGLSGSFRHALRGLVEVAARERNMRIHLFAGMAVGVVGSEVPLPLAAQLGLFLCVTLVLAGEALNSALEALVDLHTAEFRHEARRVKDAAAGAVLALSAGAVLSSAVIVAWSGTGFLAAWSAGRAGLDGALLALAAAVLGLGLGRAAVVATAAAGAALVALLALRSVSLPFTVLAAALFAWAVAARRRGTR